MTDERTGTEVSGRDPSGVVRRTRLLAVAIGGLLPVVIAGTATGLMISWIPELPDPVAVHWSGAAPDGFASAWPTVLLPLGLVVAFSAFAVGSVWTPQPSGRLGVNQKIVLVAGVWLSALLSVGIGGSFAMQRGLADAHEATDPGFSLLIGAVAGLVLACGAWFVLPKADAAAQAGIDPEPLEVTESERVAWSRTVSITPGIVWLIVVAAVLALASVVVTFIAAPDSVWFGVTTLTVVVVAAGATSWWRVSADHRGLTVRSAIGWPRVVVPADDIRAVSVVEVNPMADFGGWGYRWGGDGRRGVIMRAGNAIEVTRASGRRFVVTVDDAQTGASVLASFVDQRDA